MARTTVASSSLQYNTHPTCFQNQYEESLGFPVFSLFQQKEDAAAGTASDYCQHEKLKTCLTIAWHEQFIY